jgi:type IV secretory pathway VirB2 component (pilin)
MFNNSQITKGTPPPMKRLASRLSVVAATLLLSTHSAFASSGGGGLPWETPLRTIQQSLSGPVAFAIAVIAMAAAGGTLVFGGELTEFTRRACLLVLAIGFLVGGVSIMTLLFGVSGAVVAIL